MHENGTAYNLDKKKDELLNAHLSTLESVKTKKPPEVMKALEKSFQMRPISLL